jgi:hypothetical protein
MLYCSWIKSGCFLLRDLVAVPFEELLTGFRVKVEELNSYFPVDTEGPATTFYVRMEQSHDPD